MMTPLTYSLQAQVFNDVEIEPQLQPLTGYHKTANTDPDAEADIRVQGF